MRGFQSGPEWPGCSGRTSEPSPGNPVDRETRGSLFFRSTSDHQGVDGHRGRSSSLCLKPFTFSPGFWVATDSLCSLPWLQILVDSPSDLVPGPARDPSQVDWQQSVLSPQQLTPQRSAVDWGTNGFELDMRDHLAAAERADSAGLSIDPSNVNLRLARSSARLNAGTFAPFTRRSCSSRPRPVDFVGRFRVRVDARECSTSRVLPKALAPAESTFREMIRLQSGDESAMKGLSKTEARKQQSRTGQYP